MCVVEDVDIVYRPGQGKWSWWHLYVGSDRYFFDPTHIFNDPLQELLDGLCQILEGRDHIRLSWHDEPGEWIWHIEWMDKEKDLVRIDIREYNETIFGTPNHMTKIRKHVSFSTCFKHFCICILKQGEKTRDLMSEDSFGKGRPIFPYDSFHGFVRSFSQRYK